MVILLTLIVFLILALMATSYLLGVRIGSACWQQEVIRVQALAAEASQQMHELTRQAVVGMADEISRQRGGPRARR